MIKRTIHIGNPAHLHLKDAQMEVKYPDGFPSKTVPVEDIGLLVLDHNQISLTQGLANALIENNAAILWCNWQHLPHGLLLPTAANNIYTEKLRTQLDASEPLRKQLWKQTVRAKILNQAANLDFFGKTDGNALRRIAGKVGSGDPENMEGRAAARYWDQLLSPYHVTRGRDEGGPNLLLNYGYAVLRAIAARSLAASGCLTALGIHHRNKYNPYCLADDIMEPYRPIVDFHVFLYLEELDQQPPEELEKEHKARLLQIPAIDINIRKKNSPLMVGMQATTAGLMKCFEGESRKVPYPNIEAIHLNHKENGAGPTQ